MLKITRSTEAGTVRLTLSGRISRADLGGLEHAIASESVHPTSVTLDLEEVEIVDRDAVCFLVRSEAAGIRLVNAAEYIRGWMRREQHD